MSPNLKPATKYPEPLSRKRGSSSGEIFSTKKISKYPSHIGSIGTGICIFIVPTFDPNGCQPKNRGKTPKMDGENNGKPYEKFMIWGAHPYFWKHPNLFLQM